MIRQFEIDDLAGLQLRQSDQDAIAGLSWEEYVAGVTAAAAAGPAFTFLQHDRIIACMGVTLLSPWCGEAWVVSTPAVEHFPVFFTRSTRLALESVQEHHRLRRIQALVLDGFVDGWRWATTLGFEHEGLMRAYGPSGQNFHRMARIY